MLPHQLATLLESTPTGVTDTVELIDAVDTMFVDGLARVDPRRTETYDALTAAFGGTPLAERVAEACDKLAAGSAAEDQLDVLAGVRTALWGAVHDGMLAHGDAAIGRVREPAAEAGTTPNTLPPNLLAGCRAWLTELAIAGWHGVDEELLLAAARPVASLLEHPDGRRPAVLLDGLVNELRQAGTDGSTLPLRRWADLWTRAMTLAAGHVPAAETADAVFSGRLFPLGTELYQHPTVFAAQTHWLAEPSDGSAPRLLRSWATTSKVETISGPGLWRRLSDYQKLRTALAEDRVVTVTELPLRAGGELLWNEEAAELGETSEPFSVARVSLSRATAAAVSPWDRHPTAIGELVLLEGYKVGKADPLGFELDGSRIDVDTSRLTDCGPITDKTLKASTACLGLLRWDAGRWRIQPLAVSAKVKKVDTVLHNGQWALTPTDPKVAKTAEKVGQASHQLTERAGRLLRK